MANNALELIVEDHDEFREKLNRYEEIDPDDHEEKRQLIEELIPAVVRHSAMEEEAFYPFVRSEAPELEEMVLEEIEEHHVIEIVMAELEQLEVTNKRFDAKVEVFAENLLHHLHEEEDELFPILRERLSKDQLRQLHDDLAAAKADAPTEPDPERVGG